MIKQHIIVQYTDLFSEEMAGNIVRSQLPHNTTICEMKHSVRYTVPQK